MNALFNRLVLRVGLAFAPIFASAASTPETRVTTATAAARLTTDATTLILRKDQVREKNRFTLKGWKGDLTEAKITDLAGNDISSLLAPKTERGAVTLAQSLQPFIMKTRRPQTVAFTDQSETMLPGGLVQTFTAENVTKAIWFRLFCSVSPRPAPWNESANQYETQIIFTIKPTDGSPASITLPHPITVSLEFDGMSAQEIPTFTIDQAGIDHRQTRALHFKPSTM